MSEEYELPSKLERWIKSTLNDEMQKYLKLSYSGILLRGRAVTDYNKFKHRLDEMYRDRIITFSYFSLTGENRPPEITVVNYYDNLKAAYTGLAEGRSTGSKPPLPGLEMEVLNTVQPDKFTYYNYTELNEIVEIKEENA